MQNQIADDRSAPLHIRAARADDRPGIMQVVKTIWNGEDYIPEVWDEWLADCDGALLVGEAGGRPVALAKISALGSGEDWFHGLRVDPAWRGHGFGRAMLRRCIALARSRGARTLRYLTDAGNLTMHRMGRAHSFQLNYMPAWYSAPARLARSWAAPLAPTEIARLLGDLSHSQLLAHTRGTYAYGWHNFDLSSERLHQHLARGEVRGLPGAAAWAIVMPRHEGGWWLAHIEGQAHEIERLCLDLRGGPGMPERALRALLPPTAPCMPALQAGGLAAPSELMHVYELRLAEEPNCAPA